MAVKKGYTAKLYRNSATFGTPTWAECENVKDVAINIPFDKLEGTARGVALKQYEPGLGDLSITGKFRTNEDDTDFVAFETAHLAKSLIDLMVLDGGSTTTGSRGYRVECKIFNFSEDQAHGNILYRDFEAAPCITTNAQQTVVVTAGAPVFTTFSAA